MDYASIGPGKMVGYMTQLLLEYGYFVRQDEKYAAKLVAAMHDDIGSLAKR